MNRLRELRKSKRLTQAELASRLNITQSAYSLWETGKSQIASDSLNWLSSFYGVSVDYILGNPERTAKRSWIPVLGDVAAGVPIEAIERYPDDDDNWEQLDEEMLNDGYEYFALRIKGESMLPRISDGDVVIVRKQPTVENDEIAVVKVDGEDATVKRVRKTADGVWLLPTNPAYTPMFYSKDQDVSVLGKVVELRAKF